MYVFCVCMYNVYAHDGVHFRGKIPSSKHIIRYLVAFCFIWCVLFFWFSFHFENPPLCVYTVYFCLDRLNFNFFLSFLHVILQCILCQVYISNKNTNTYLVQWKNFPNINGCETITAVAALKCTALVSLQHTHTRYIFCILNRCEEIKLMELNLSSSCI